MIDALKDFFKPSARRGRASIGLSCSRQPVRCVTADDVQRVLEAGCRRRAIDSVATFTEAELNPHRAWRLVDGVPEVFIPGAIPWLPRQKLPKAYQLNGAVYVFRAKLLAEESSPSWLEGSEQY